MDFDPSLCTPVYVQFLTETNNKWLQSVTFAYVAYGIELTFYFMCCTALIAGASFKRRRWLSRQNSAFLLYITTMMVLSTIVLVSTVQGTNAALITSGCWDPDFNPAGPGLTLMGFRTWPLLNLGADGLLVSYPILEVQEISQTKYINLDSCGAALCSIRAQRLSLFGFLWHFHAFYISEYLVCSPTWKSRSSNQLTASLLKQLTYTFKSQ